MTTTTTLVSEEQRRQYREEGWCLLERAIPEDLLELLRGSAQAAVDELDAELDRLGTDVRGITRRGERYFATHPSFAHPELYRFILSDLMAEVTQALLGPDVFVFFEQYVIKGADGGCSFSWHQDSAYVGFPHAPYLTCWCALDDMSEANGTARILPTSRGGARGLVEHRKDPDTNDLIGYDGDDPGDPVICPAGSIACFSSHTLHCSGANQTPRMRRTYLIQYSGEVIRKPGAVNPFGRCEPFLRGGRRVLRAC